MMTYRVILRDLLNFLKKPNDFQIHLPFKEKLVFFFKLFLIEIVISILFVFPILFITDEFLHIKHEPLDYSDSIRNSLLLYVLLAPLVEELIFRLVLRYNKFFKIFIDREKWNRIFPFLVYFSFIVFGFIHLLNYENDTYLFYLFSPLIVLTQVTGGIMISYLRVRINFLLGFLYHALWNFIIVFGISFIYLTFSEPYVTHTDFYSMKIEEDYFIREGVTSFNIDEVENTLYFIDAEQYSLQDVLDIIYGNKKYYVDDIYVDIEFQSEKGISKEEFLKILQEEYDIEEY